MIIKLSLSYEDKLIGEIERVTDVVPRVGEQIFLSNKTVKELGDKLPSINSDGIIGEIEYVAHIEREDNNIPVVDYKLLIEVGVNLLD